MANKFGLLVLVFLVGLLAACGQDEVVEDVVTGTAVPVSPTSIPLSPTPTPTATTIPTQTPTPPATATATAIPTLTPLPTFAPEELETAVADLLANPMNCDVPCWWGAIPGETTIDEIKHFIAPYNFSISNYFDEKGNDYFLLGIGHVEESNDFEVRIVFGFSDSILSNVTAYSPPVSEILAKFGQPEVILISASNDSRTWPPDINIYLIYLQENMAFGYSVKGTVQDDWVKACFADETGQAQLKKPNSVTEKTIFDEFAMFYPDDFLYFPLEEATQFTMADFMQHFNDPNQPQCIETPIDIWGWD